MEKYFPESEVTQSERDYETAVSVKYNGDDLSSYIINKSKELNFNGEEVDPVDFLRDYLVGKEITTEQFVSLTEPMKVQVIEMGKKLSDEMVTNLSSVLKVRYAVLRLGNLFGVNLGLYSNEERGRVLNNLKDKLDSNIIAFLIIYTPKEQQYELVKQILPLVKDKLNKDIISIMLDITPKKERYELALQIFVYVKDKLNKDIIEILLSYTPKEHKQEIQALIDKYQQKDVVNELRLMVRKILKENY